MTEEEKVFQVVRQCLESILVERDIDKTMQFISDSILGMGMGDQGTASSKKELLDILLAQSQGASVLKKCQLEFPKTDIRCFSNMFAIGSVLYKMIFEVEGKRQENSFLQTIAAKKEQNEWKLCLLQVIPIDLSEEGIEHYSIKFADTTLAQLKTELQQDTFELINKSFSGGILGVQGEFPYSLYFANDTIIDMLGYERSEFENKFKNKLGDIFDLNDDETKEIRNKITTAQDFFSRCRLIKKDGTKLWAEICSRKTKDEQGLDILLSVVIDVSEIVNLQIETMHQHQTILSSIEYAAKIQNTLLPSDGIFEKAFQDYSILWDPKDVVGGDIYWLKEFEEGYILCVCDCTGHGIPGALLTMLVISILDNMVEEDNYKDTRSIVFDIDSKIAEVLNVKNTNIGEKQKSILNIHDGCDLAVLYIDKDGTVSISAANTYIFVCDGEKVTRVKGQRLNIGEGNIIEKEKIKVVTVPYNPFHRFYVSSDGLFDQIGGSEGKPFGFLTFQNIILNNYNHSQDFISERIWEAFEEYKSTNIRRDDIEMISFVPKASNDSASEKRKIEKI